MSLNLHTKLFLTLLLTLFLVILGMGFFIQWSFDRGLVNYVNTLELQRISPLAEALGDDYVQHGGWEHLKDDNYAAWRSLLRRYLFPGQHYRRQPPLEPLAPFAPAAPLTSRNPTSGDERALRPPPRNLHKRLQLLDADRHLIIGKSTLSSGAAELEIVHAGKRLGTLQIRPQEELSEVNDLRFLQAQTNAFVYITLGMALVAAVVSWLISRRLKARLLPLTQATRKLSSGDYDIEIATEHHDELGQLSADFNQLARTLKQHEQARRQWVADIAHELRTPLAILQGEIEAMEDGIRPPSPPHLASLHSEVKHLSALVNDLYELSLSDAGALTYRKQTVDLGTLLLECITRWRSEFDQAGIALDLALPSGLTIYGDPDRLQQLCANLLKNTLRYTDAPGQLAVHLRPNGEHAQLHFADSAPGVPPAELERIFERLYRVEKSRSRALGGGGLGLSICQNIVTAHDGSIHAEHASLGGLKIVIELPLMR